MHAIAAVTLLCLVGVGAVLLWSLRPCDRRGEACEAKYRFFTSTLVGGLVWSWWCGYMFAVRGLGDKVVLLGVEGVGPGRV